MPKRPDDIAGVPAASETQRQAGLRIRAIRALAGVTQEQICEVLGVDQSTWSKWERGERLPDLFVMSRFAARARTSLDLIYRGELSGTHPELRRLLLLRIPELLAPVRRDTDQDMDRAQASYRAAIDPVLSDRRSH